MVRLSLALAAIAATAITTGEAFVPSTHTNRPAVAHRQTSPVVPSTTALDAAPTMVIY